MTEQLKRRRMDEIIERFMRDAGKDEPVFFDDSHLQGIYQREASRRYGGNDTIYSYGTHFPLAEIIPHPRKRKTDQRRGWWLLNGDVYRGSSGWGHSTSGQQATVRRLAKQTGLPALIAPFSALESAGIIHNSIRTVEVTEDSYTWDVKVYGSNDRPFYWDSPSAFRNWERLPDGRWQCEVNTHHLGEAVFRASYSYTERVRPASRDADGRYVPGEDRTVKGTAYFLSGFDEQEAFGLYFLCQLPAGARPKTVAEARETLKPPAVKLAESYGIEVLRQGDVFAVNMSDIATRDLPGPSLRNERVLGVNHTATEVRMLGDRTYGRGVLRHAVPWPRRPEHRMVKLGNGRDWYLLVKNTVPMGRSAGRAWTIAGNVD